MNLAHKRSFIIYLQNLHSLARINSSMHWEKSRICWFGEGDANNKLFHGVSSSRRRSNAIHSINGNGHKVVENFTFKSLSLVQGVYLLKPFNLEEAKQVIWHCDNYKNSAPMVLIFVLSKSLGKILKSILCASFKSFIEMISWWKVSPTFLSPLFLWWIALKDYHPCIPYECLYKVLAKVFVNQLRTVIEIVISEEQSTFVHGCQITNGILMGNELVDETRKLKKELIIFKVDFEKGFDSVDCNYLDVVLLDLINKYVNVVCYRTFVIDACKPTAPTTIAMSQFSSIFANVNLWCGQKVW